MLNTVILVLFEKSFSHHHKKKFILLTLDSTTAASAARERKIYPFYLIASYAPHTQKKTPKWKFSSRKSCETANCVNIFYEYIHNKSGNLFFSRSSTYRASLTQINSTYSQQQHLFFRWGFWISVKSERFYRMYSVWNNGIKETSEKLFSITIECS